MDSALPLIIALVVAGLLLLLLLRRGKRVESPQNELSDSARTSEAREAAAALARRTQISPDAAKQAEPRQPEVPLGQPLSREAGQEAIAPQPTAAAAGAFESAESALLSHADDLEVLRKGLANTRGGFIARLAKLFGARPSIDAALLEQIEEVLITADIGVKTSERALTRLREQMASGTLKTEDDVWKSLRDMAVDVLNVPTKGSDLANKPSLILIVGVNGAGKTTSIGKLAARYAAEGRKVLLAAGDTYRAAAVLQLEVWGRRVNCPVIKGKEGGDPSAVIFEAIKRAQTEGYDLVIADTAGRLHTKAPLMEELKKVDRTVQKALNGRPADEIFLVLDATTGQNAVQQMHMFREALPVSGVVLTKLDGTAKGGMVLGIVDEHRVPVRFIGLGERVEDLREFDAPSFVEALFSKPNGETLAA
jgi:fused signal recognition particle receptor